MFTAEMGATGPRLPFGDEVEIAMFEKGEEYLQPPDRKTRFPGVPKFSPMRSIAERLPTPENGLFAKNAANRLWFLLMGRGLVHPLDLQHADNPPSHPELLDLLGAEVAAHGFDIKWLMRELVLSDTYQRSSLLPEGADRIPEDRFAVAIERRVSAEQLLRSTLQATGEQQRAETDEKLDEYRDAFVTAFGNVAREPEEQFAPTLKSALFIANGGTVLEWVQPREGNLVDRLSKIENAGELSEELYLTVLSRPPADEEQSFVAEYLGRHADDRPAAIGSLVWSLLASTEFCTNH